MYVDILISLGMAPRTGICMHAFGSRRRSHAEAKHVDILSLGHDLMQVVLAPLRSNRYQTLLKARPALGIGPVILTAVLSMMESRGVQLG